jgi:hypothetical protein
LLFLCCAPIMWYLKQQNIVEKSAFGLGSIASKKTAWMIQVLWYKLQMMGISIDGPTHLFCNNKAVVRNLTLSESTLKKKHVTICYYCVQEACALGMIQVAKEDGARNVAYL